MGEPTDEVELSGGRLDGLTLDGVRAPALVLPLAVPWCDGVVPVHYADSGRRTAEGRRVFVPEG
jgi:hypothetical protein